MNYSLPYYGYNIGQLPQYKFGDKLKKGFRKFGNWTKDNTQGVVGGLKTVGGAALALTGLGAPLGIGLMASGVSDISQEIKGDRMTKEADLQQTQQVQQQDDFLSKYQEIIDANNESQTALLEEQQKMYEEREKARIEEEEKKRQELELSNIQTGNINQRIQGETTSPKQYSFGCGGKLLGNYAFGGPIINNYKKGQLHSGPSGGIPVDENGTPSVMSKTNPVGLTENGELTYNGYVFSNSIPYKRKI